MRPGYRGLRRKAQDSDARNVGIWHDGNRDPAMERSMHWPDARVVITISKDNKLVWIRTAKYAVAVHGANAIQIYDNGSTHIPTRIA